MTTPPGPSRSTEGMVDYAANSQVQRTMVGLHAPLIRRLVNSLEPASPEFRIADFGCGPGQSAIEAVRPAIEAWRAGGNTGCITVCHADQPGNDWNALFARATGPEGYTRDAGDIRIEACVGSFYDQMVGTGSVDIATSFAASHWLGGPVRLHSPGTVWFADLAPAARAELRDRALADWSRFLHCRARELRPGGVLLVVTIGAIPDAADPSGFAVAGRGLYRAVQQVAEGMAQDGLIDRDVLDHFVFGFWFLSEAEARAPFETDRDLASAFTVEEISLTPPAPDQRDIFAPLLSDPDAYARAYSGAFRACGLSSLRSYLLAPSARDAGHEEDLEREFFRRFEDLYRREPGRHAFEVFPLRVVLRRR